MYEPDEKAWAQINSAFKYHPPHGDQAERYTQIREQGRIMAAYLAVVCPPSRELSLALTNLQQAVMWANAAIACNERPPSSKLPPLDIIDDRRPCPKCEAPLDPDGHRPGRWICPSCGTGVIDLFPEAQR